MGLHFATVASGSYSPWHYCFNDPVNFVDECGYASSSIKDSIKSYAKETWIAWILNKFINKVTKDGRLELIKFNKLGLEMYLFLEATPKKQRNPSALKQKGSGSLGSPTRIPGQMYLCYDPSVNR